MAESGIDGRPPGGTLERYSRLTQGPLMVLALLMVPVLLAPLVLHLSAPVEQTLVAVDYLIWAVFGVDYVVRLYLATKRWEFVRRNIPDLIVVAVPFLRPLRVLRSARALRLLRLARLGAFASGGLRELRKVLHTRGLNYVLLIVLAMTFISSGLVVEFERASPTANIHGFGDALWWAFTTVTTVGYGDRFPTTPAGRGVGVMLMIAGISAFGVLTAAVASYFVGEQEEKKVDEQTVLMKELIVRLQALEERLGSEEAGDSRVPI
jgi:voltage-gated potassium channel